MEKKPKTRENLWKTQDILLAIPKIEHFLIKNININTHDTRYRSLSEPFYPAYSSTPATQKNKHHKKQENLFQHKFNKSFVREKNKDYKGKKTRFEENNSRIRMDFFKDEEKSFIEKSKILASHMPRMDKRKQIQIPVIKLEKNLPQNYRTRSVIISHFENKAPTEPKKKNTGCIVLEVNFPTTGPAKHKFLHKAKVERNAKTAMRDESVGIDRFYSQSSGVFSEATLTTHYMPMFSPEIN